MVGKTMNRLGLFSFYSTFAKFSLIKRNYFYNENNLRFTTETCAGLERSTLGGEAGR